MKNVTRKKSEALPVPIPIPVPLPIPVQQQQQISPCAPPPPAYTPVISIRPSFLIGSYLGAVTPTAQETQLQVSSWLGVGSQFTFHEYIAITAVVECAPPPTIIPIQNPIEPIVAVVIPCTVQNTLRIFIPGGTIIHAISSETEIFITQNFVFTAEIRACTTNLLIFAFGLIAPSVNTMTTSIIIG